MGAIADLLAEDHRRLERLLDAATREPGRIDPEPFAAFRAGILRHIGMEERILFPAAREARGGEPVPAFARLRADHARITALMVPTPTPELVAELVAILDPHDALEEGEGGVYAACEEAIGDGAEALVDRLKAAPDVPLRPHYDRRRPVILEEG